VSSKALPDPKTVWGSKDGRIVLVTEIRPAIPGVDWDLISAKNPRARRHGRNVPLATFLKAFSPAADPRRAPTSIRRCRFCANDSQNQIEESRTWPGSAVCVNGTECASRFRERVATRAA
jgi:hypothetical protein